MLAIPAMSRSYVVSVRCCLAMCCLALLVISSEGGKQAAPKEPSTIGSSTRCPLSVQKMMQYAPEESVAAVKKACKPTGNSGFCEACICTVFVNFVPATLRSAGVVTSKTPQDAAEEAIGSCAPSSHVALLRLGALNEDWSAALNRQCDGNTTVHMEGVCEPYVPAKLPTRKSAAAAASPAEMARLSKCPFQESDIKPTELAPARAACGASTANKDSFCRSCLCAIQTNIDDIIARRKAALDSNVTATDADYKGCYIILTHALVEGDVLTPEAASVLGSEVCKPLAQLSSAERRSECSPEPEEVEAPSTDAPSTPEAVNATQAASNTSGSSSQRSGGSLNTCGGAAGYIATLLPMVFTALAWGLF